MTGFLILVLVVAFIRVGILNYRCGLTEESYVSDFCGTDDIILTVGMAVWAITAYYYANVQWYWSVAIWLCGISISWLAFNAGDTIRRSGYSRLPEADPGQG